MKLAHLIRGPMDDEYLPYPFPILVPTLPVPEFGVVTVTYFYLLAGEEEPDVLMYLYDDPSLEVSL